MSEQFSAKTAAECSQGKITFPPAGSKADRQFNIDAYTRNIPIERPYIWLTVNVKDLGLCWPKKPWIKANSGFNTTIYKGGHRKEFAVCLPVILRHYKLDEVTYWLEGR